MQSSIQTKFPAPDTFGDGLFDSYEEYLFDHPEIAADLVDNERKEVKS